MRKLMQRSWQASTADTILAMMLTGTVTGYVNDDDDRWGESGCCTEKMCLDLLNEWNPDDSPHLSADIDLPSALDWAISNPEEMLGAAARAAMGLPYSEENTDALE
jgi:hypothetical protein